MGNFVWFLITLIVAISNIILSVFIYFELQRLKIKNKKVHSLKEICFYYASGMMIAMILSIGLFIATTPL